MRRKDSWINQDEFSKYKSTHKFVLLFHFTLSGLEMRLA